MDAPFDEHTRAGFLIERYPPETTIDQVRAGAEHLASAVELIRGTGVAITYVGAVWVPDDDTIFYALVADSTETVYDAIRRAGTPVDRMTPAHFVTPATTTHAPAQCLARHRQYPGTITTATSKARDERSPDEYRRRRAVPQPIEHRERERTMTTTTPLLKAHPPSRRVLTVALAFGAGTALGVAGMALISRDHAVTRVPGAEPRIAHQAIGNHRK